jgi:hypothetical protein
VDNWQGIHRLDRGLRARGIRVTTLGTLVRDGSDAAG